MAILVSPGVSVTVTDESQYGSAGPGTIPLIVIATQADKLQPGSTVAVAAGTTLANAKKLWLITSQRDALTTFGSPVFYSSGGTVQYDNELNELGLFTLYEYLGIANQAYVLRADIDLAELIPQTTAPVGPPSTNQNWLDISATTYGIFRSNGNTNPAFSWVSQVPLVINDMSQLEIIKQGHISVPGSKITSGSMPVISANGMLVINGNPVNLTTGQSISEVASSINNSAPIRLLSIAAFVVSRVEKIDPTLSNFGSVFSLRLVSSNVENMIDLTGSDTSVLTDLGMLPDVQGNVVLPAAAYGIGGNFAVNTLMDASGSYKNQIWEKIEITSSGSTIARWFKVGSTDAGYPGWGWSEAAPRIITGTVANPIFNAGDTCTIAIGNSGILTVTVPAGGTLSGFVSAINTILDANSLNAIATVYTVGSQNYLRIINFDGTNVQLNDNSDQYDTISIPFRTAGMPVTNTYWGSVTGTVANPTYTAAILKTASADTVTAGTNYNVGDALTVQGGTFTTASVLVVASIKADSVGLAAGGSQYATNDTLTFSGAGWTSPLILQVTHVGVGGSITQVNIVQAGQYTGVTPSNPVSATGTSGSGSNASFNISWGINTVSVGTPGSYTIYPTNPVSVNTGAATFNLTPTWLQSNSFSIDPGTGTPVIVHVPASPNNTLDGVINEINNVAFPAGPIVASKMTDGLDNYLVLTNTNGTAFTVEDIRGTPLNDSGISAGVTFGRKLVYQGWQPSLTAPTDLASLAPQNVWINTTPGNQGANYVARTYVNNVWATLNIHPNLGVIPMYSSDNAANVAFGGLKQIGSTYVRYNSDGDTPAEANHELFTWTGSTWEPLVYTPSPTAPAGLPLDGTLWYNTALRADVMVNDGTQWVGWRNKYPATDPNGVILDSAEPATQSTLTPLVDYDLWLDTSATPYPKLHRYNASTSSWVVVDNTDHISAQGIIFADARPNADGTLDGSVKPSDMVLSNYVDPDVPDALLYAAGIMLFNTRYSTYNVKVYRKNYLTTGSYRDRWVTASGNAPNGTPYMGPAAQRQMVVESLKAALNDSTEARAEQNYFNLLAVPGYTETLAEMITLNTDKNEVAFIVADPPPKLDASGTSIYQWATDANNAADNGPSGLISSTPYAGVYYPWGLGSNLDGNSVFVPPSLTALRTIAFNDQVAYPWFAPAGFNRGLVTGISSVGYLDSAGDYVPVTLNQGQRDVLYTNRINPIAYIPGRGLVVYGQKTLNPVASALDRINVARLVNYLKYQLDNLAKPFLFEPNDAQTRANVTAAFKAFLNNLLSQRALYDFAVICDTSNNTPARIDRNELWIDIAIKPEKAIEFIYIPIRILNTGAPLPGGTAG
jgi:Phage tail sheath C-terminal domain